MKKHNYFLLVNLIMYFTVPIKDVILKPPHWGRIISPIFLFTYEEAELKKLAPGPPDGKRQSLNSDSKSP